MNAKESNFIAKSIIEGIGELVWAIDINKILIFANEVYKQKIKSLTGVAPKIGDPVIVNFKEDDFKEDWDEFYNRGLQGERFVIEKESYLNGDFFYMEINFLPIIEDGKITGLTCYFRNKNETKYYYKGLRVTEEKYLLLFKDNPTPMMISDLNSLMVLEVNNAAIASYGYSREEFKTMTIKDYRPPEDLSRLSTWLKQLHETSRNTGVFKHIRKNGEIFSVEVTARLIEYENKKCALVLLIDISDKEKTEELLHQTNEALKVSEDRFKVMFESSLDGQIISKADETIHEVNPAICKMLGYTREQFLKLTKTDFISETHDKRIRVKEELSTKGYYSGVFILKCQNGKLLDTEISISVFRDSLGDEYSHSSIRDISEKILAQKKIKESQANLYTIINNTSDTIFSVDKDYKILSANNTFRENVFQLIGKRYKEGDYLFTNNGADQLSREWKNYIDEALSGEELKTESAYQIGEQTYYNESSINPIRQGNEVIGVVCFSRNITDRKRIEMERVRITKDLIDRNKNLEQFSYIVSHNLRAPVANIIGLCDLINNVELSTQQFQNCVNAISPSAKNLDVIINDLNDILQIKQEVFKVREVVRFSEITENVKRSISIFIKDVKANILTDFTEFDELVTVKGYIYSLFYNLILNSIKYKRLETAPIIEIKSRKLQNKIEIVFKDNGLGIDLEKHGNKVFGLYNRFHPHIEGKGLGLFMVKTQLESIGGIINIRSEVNTGTEFIIEFVI